MKEIVSKKIVHFLFMSSVGDLFYAKAHSYFAQLSGAMIGDLKKKSTIQIQIRLYHMESFKRNVCVCVRAIKNTFVQRDI